MDDASAVVVGEAAIEEVEGMVAQLAVACIGLNYFIAAGPRERHLHNFANGGGRAVGHHHNPVCQEEGLVDIVGNHQNGWFAFCPNGE